MPVKITPDCVKCAACADVCPNDGIREGNSVYIINQDFCTECVGFFAQEQCIAVCPMDCFVRNPKMVLTEEALFERAKAIHANSDKQPTLSAETSHFRAGSHPAVHSASLRWWERLFGRKTPVQQNEVLLPSSK